MFDYLPEIFFAVVILGAAAFWASLFCYDYKTEDYEDDLFLKPLE